MYLFTSITEGRIVGQGKRMLRADRKAIIRRRLAGEPLSKVARIRGCSETTVDKYAPKRLLDRIRRFLERRQTSVVVEPAAIVEPAVAPVRCKTSVTSSSVVDPTRPNVVAMSESAS